MKKITCFSLFLFVSIPIISSCSTIRNNEEVKQKNGDAIQIETKETTDSDSTPQTGKEAFRFGEVETKHSLFNKDFQSKVINIISKVNAITQDSSSIIKIDTNKNAKYTAFFLNNPLRFVMDFEKTTIMADEPSIFIDDPFIKRVRFYKTLPGDFARMEIYLKKKPDYNLKQVGNELKLNLIISEAESRELRIMRTALDKREKEVSLLKDKVANLEYERKTLLNKIKKSNIEEVTDEDKIKKIFNEWIIAWEKKDLDAFISFYSDKFTGKQMNLDQWKADKKRTFEKYSEIKVIAEDLKVAINNNSGKIEFIQIFSGDLYSDTGVKKLYLRQEANNWKIVKEMWSPMEAVSR